MGSGSRNELPAVAGGNEVELDRGTLRPECSSILFAPDALERLGSAPVAPKKCR